MNVDKIRALADFLETKSNHWDLSTWCGCFVGNYFASQGRSIITNGVYNLADEFGLDKEAILKLTMPALGQSEAAEINKARAAVPKEHAIAVLRHLADTGEVDWSVTTYPRMLPESITKTLQVPTWEDFEATA